MIVLLFILIAGLVAFIGAKICMSADRSWNFVPWYLDEQHVVFNLQLNSQDVLLSNNHTVITYKRY